MRRLHHRGQRQNTLPPAHQCGCIAEVQAVARPCPLRHLSFLFPWLLPHVIPSTVPTTLNSELDGLVRRGNRELPRAQAARPEACRGRGASRTGTEMMVWPFARYGRDAPSSSWLVSDVRGCGLVPVTPVQIRGSKRPWSPAFDTTATLAASNAGDRERLTQRRDSVSTERADHLSARVMPSLSPGVGPTLKL